MAQPQPAKDLSSYKPFSDPKNIDVMVRTITVFVEQETLEIDFDEKSPLFDIPINYAKWVKYVSRKSTNPAEVNLYWDLKSENDFDRRLIERLIKDGNFFEKIEDYFLRSYQNLNIFTDDLFKKGEKFFKKQTNQQLISLFNQFNKLNRALLSGYYIVFYGVEAIEILVIKELKKMGIKDVDEFTKQIGTLAIQSIVQAERIEFLHKLEKIQSIYHQSQNFEDPQIQQLIYDQWYFYGPCVFAHKTNKPYTLKQYQKKFFRCLDLDIKAKLGQIKSNEKKDLSQLEDKLIHLKKYPQILKHIKCLRKMVGYRNKEELYYWTYFDHASPLFKEIGRRLKISLKEVWLLSKEEIIDGLKWKINCREILEKREKEGFTIKWNGRKIVVFTGVKEEDTHQVGQEHLNKDHVIRGGVACRGYAKGKVKVVFNPTEEGRDFKKGEILVTSMTTPDFVPLMKRAQAVITDEGGLLCHAAIVSRELGVPCITGTKVATQVLKSGNLVEVDANNGIVKILS